MAGQRGLAALANACTLVLVLFVAVHCPAAQERLLQPALASAADYSPVYPTRVFPSGTRELIAVFRLGKGESFKSIVGQLVAVDVGASAPANFPVAHAELRSRGAERGRFRFDLPRPFPPGRYRLVVTADGQPWSSAEFTVSPPSDYQSSPMSAEMVVPLTDGHSWTYDLTIEPGPGVRLTLDNAKPGADGKFHGTATTKVLGHDSAGIHVEMQGRGLLEEWWQIGPKGLVVTQRKIEGEMFVADPPQLILPWPPKAPQGWDWRHKDRSIPIRQIYHMWGPVAVEGPNGPASGFVVFGQEQPNSDDPTSFSFERHYLPGFGVVREVLVNALRGDLVFRQELNLRK